MPVPKGSGVYVPPKHRRKKKRTPAPYFGPSDIATEVVRQNRTPFRLPPSAARKAAKHEVRQRRKNAKIAAARARVEEAQNAIEGLRAQTEVQRSESSSALRPIATNYRAGVFPVDDAITKFGIQTLGELTQAGIYSPVAAYQISKGVGLDVRDLATQGDFTPERTAGMAQQIGTQVAQDIRHPLRHPGYTLFDALGIGSGVAGLGARGAAGLGAATAAREAGAGVPRAAGAAFFRSPAEGGSLLLKPPPGRAEIAPGVFKYYSTNPLARGFQKARVRKQLRHPESRVGGGAIGRKGPERVGYERRRQARIEQDVARAPSEALKKRARKASKEEQLAVRVVGEQAPIADRIRVHEEELSTITRPMTPAAFLKSRKLKERIKLLKSIRAKGLVSENGVGRFKIVPGEKLKVLVDRAETSVLRREDIIKELGLTSEEALAARRGKPARVFAGARYEKPTPGKRGVKSQALIKAEAREARLTKLHERASERAAKRAEPVQLVETGETVTTLRREPRTEAEAQAYVKKIDALEEKQLKAIEKKLTGGQPADMAEVRRIQGQTNKLFNPKTGRPRQKGKGYATKRPTTVKQDLRARAQAELDKALKSKDPAMQKLAAAFERRDRLKAELTERALPLGEEHGTTLYHVAPKSQRDNIAREGLADKLTGKGVFLWDNLEDAKRYQKLVGGDLYKVDRRGLNLHEDPWWTPERRKQWGGPGKSVVSHEGIPSTHVSREDAEFGTVEKKVTGKERKPSDIPPRGTYTGTTERLGGALSVARSERQRLEAAARKREKPTGLVGGEGAAEGRFYVPGSERRRGVGRVKTGASRAVGVVRTKQALHGEYTGVSARLGVDPTQALRAIAETEQEGQRLGQVLRNRAYAESISISSEDLAALPEKQRAHYIPVRVPKRSRTGRVTETAAPFSKNTQEFLDRMNKKAAEGLNMTRQEKRQLRKMADEATDFFFPNTAEKVAFAKDAAGEVRFVDTRKLGGAQKVSGQADEWLRPLGQVTDEVNAVMQLGFLFLKPAYLIPNLIGQTALAFIQQGLMAPRNLGRAAQVWHDLGHFDDGIEVRQMVKAGVGLEEGGLTKGGQTGGRVAGPVRDAFAHAYGKVLDSPFRWPAFIHEARKLGYTKTTDIVRLMKDKDAKTVADRNEIFQRTRDAMVDYSDMNDFEKNVVRRAIFFYPWVKGSTVYTARFLRDHPIQAAVLAQASRPAAETVKRILGPRPFYARGIFPTGGTDAAGNPLVADPTAAGLFSYPGQIAEAAKQLVSRNPKAGYTIADFLSPALGGVTQLITPHDPLSGYQLSVPEALKRQFITGLPQYRLYKGITDPTDPNDLYPTSKKSAWGKFLIGGVFPHPVNVKELNSRAAEEGRSALSPAERAYADVFSDRKAVFEAVKKYVPNELDNGRLPAPVREAYNRKAARNATLSAVESKTDPATQERERVKYQAEVALLNKWQVISGGVVAAAMAWAKSASYENLKTARTELSDRYFSKAYNDLLLDVHKYLEGKGATFAAG